MSDELAEHMRYCKLRPVQMPSQHDIPSNLMPSTDKVWSNIDRMEIDEPTVAISKPKKATPRTPASRPTTNADETFTAPAPVKSRYNEPQAVDDRKPCHICGRKFNSDALASTMTYSIVSDNCCLGTSHSCL